MKYEILYKGAFPALKVYLTRGESFKAESDAMVTMKDTIDVTGNLEGGVLSGLGRMLAGEKFFFQNLTAARGDGDILLAPTVLGDIIDIDLDGSYELTVQKDGFFAGESSIQVSTKMQNLSRGLFSGEGFFVLNISGRGKVFVSSLGAIHAINLEPSEQIIIDNHHLVAWPSYMNYTIEKASSKGWISSFTSGEGLVCRFRGPGIVLIQTRNPKGVAMELSKLMPVKQ
ncbi:MAG: TIGR00266 family protein [Oscillospiraceae bacterium]|nr:TIGR00266 family protein [Oscillospiraceae bacterium]